MKLTWFGGTALRIYLGGEIVVVDADDTPAGVERGEVISGASQRVGLVGDSGVRVIDPATWRPRPVGREIDEARAPPVDVLRIGPAALLMAGPGDPPLVLLGSGEAPRFGRWADGAVIVLLHGSEELAATASVILDVARPKLIVIAADEQTLDLTIAELSEHLDGAGLVSLEPGLALEV